MSKSQSILSLVFASLLFWNTPAIAGSAEAAQAVSKSTPKSAVGTQKLSPATNAPIVVPVSEFNPAAGRNPFFPGSSRSVVGQESAKSGKSAPQPALMLQGISGRFALINGRTFEVNEEADITVGRGRVHVRCVSINDGAVTVECDGKPVELKLRAGI
jgi:hypothetical protein